MGGIVGSLRRDVNAPDRGLLVKQTEWLTSRGPDEGAVYLDERFSLGHRRLDVEGRGHQPHWDGEGRIGVVVDGFVDDTRGLCERLRSQGHAVTEDTASVVIAAYREWGDRAVERLTGAFAFALVDRHAAQLVLARDRLGVRPLYFHADARRVVFASEMRALLADPAVPKVLDPKGVAAWFAWGVGGRLVRDVQAVPAGEVLVFDAHGARGRRYWSPGAVTSAEEDAFTRLRARFEQCAVAPPEPSVVALSGGRWSSALASWRRQDRGLVRSFTQPGWDGEDRRESRRLAHELQLEHREGELDVSPHGARRALVNMDLPIADPSFVGEHVAFEQLANQWPGAEVILVGHAVPGAPASLGIPARPSGLLRDIDALVQEAPAPTVRARLEADLERVDRLAVAAGRPVRAPFADPSLIETMAGYKAPLDVERLVRGVVPTRVEKRGPRRPEPPLSGWMRGPANKWLETLFFERPGGASGLVDTGRVRRWWYEHQLGLRDRASRLWRVAVFEHWCRYVMDGETTWTERRRRRRRTG